MKATQFRAQLFRVLAQVLSDGKVLEIELSGRVLEIRPKPLPGTKLGRLVRRAIVTSREDDLLSAGWDVSAWERKWDERLETVAVPRLAPQHRRAAPKPRRKRARSKNTLNKTAGA
jgi:hypothetical protein